MPRQTQQPGIFADIRWGRFTFWLIAGMLLMVSTLSIRLSSVKLLVK